MPIVEKARKIVGEKSHIGLREFPNGTVITGNYTENGPEYYFHRLFGPLAVQEIDDLQNAIGFPIPEPLYEFYRVANGFMLYDSYLNIYGVQKYLDRGDFDAMHCLPFDVYNMCIYYKTINMNNKDFVFSKYKDNTLIYINNSSLNVHRCAE